MVSVFLVNVPKGIKTHKDETRVTFCYSGTGEESKERWDAVRSSKRAAFSDISNFRRL